MEIEKRILVSLPSDLVARVDKLIGKGGKRSKIIESALREYISKESRRKLNKRDIEILNSNAEKLNEEALDVLEYQEVNW